MIKILCFMKRKPGLTREEFRTYYEDHHVPLITRLMPNFVDYRRNFISDRLHESAHLLSQDVAADDFDVLTELTYADEAMYQKTLAALADPVIGRIIRDDEEKLFDRSSMRAFIADERSTPPA